MGHEGFGVSGWRGVSWDHEGRLEGGSGPLREFPALNGSGLPTVREGVRTRVSLDSTSSPPSPSPTTPYPTGRVGVRAPGELGVGTPDTPGVWVDLYNPPNRS